MRPNAAFVLLMLVAALVTPAAAEAQAWRTVAKTRRVGSEEFLDVRIEYAVGRFQLKRGSDQLLYRLNSRYDEDAFKLRSSYIESDGHGSLRIDIEGHREFDLGRLRDYNFEGGLLELDISGSTPVDLRMELGAVEARMDLGGLRLRRLHLQTGASETHIRFSEPNPDVAESCSFEAGAAAFRVQDLGNSGCRELEFKAGIGALELDFSGEWDHSARGEIKIGLGAVEIFIPSELGVRIERRTFLMSFDAPGFEKRDGAWYSRNWDTATYQLTLDVSGAFGSVEVTRI